MGGRLSFDKNPSQISDLINIHIEGSRLMRQPPPPDESIRHHLSIWRVLETGEGVVCEPVKMQSEDAADIQFISTEAYIVLVVTKLPSSKCSEPLPVYFWAALQSMQSLTQQSVSEPLYSLKNQKFRCDLYALKGKWLRPVVSVRTLGLAFQLESTLKRGGEHLQQLLFNGIYVEKIKLVKSDLLFLQRDLVAIPFGEALLSQLLKKEVSLLQRLYLGEQQTSGSRKSTANLPFLKETDRKKLFANKPTTCLSSKSQQPGINPSLKKQIDKPVTSLAKVAEPVDDHPFLVEITEIRQDNDFRPPPPIKTAEDLNMDDFERELEESLAYRQTHQFDEDEPLAVVPLEDEPNEEKELEEPPNYSDQSLVRVTDGLFISGERGAYSLEELQKNNITLVINVAADYCINRFPGEVEYMSYFSKDSQNQNIECLFYPCIEKIQEHIENKGGALVHCVRGVSRSASLVAAFLILMKKVSYQQAEKLLRAKRPQASPNNGFMLQLINFHKRVNFKYEAQPFQPKVFGVSSYQQESPKEIVVRHIQDKLFKTSANGLDPRGVFIIQHEQGIFVWRGGKCQYMQLYMEAAMKHIQFLLKYESAVNNVSTISEGSEPENFWKAMQLPGRPGGNFTNSSMLYLPVQSKYVPRGICNPQILVFRLGSTVPLPHRKLSEDNFYLLCKETREGVRFVMWMGNNWKQDESAEAMFLQDIRDLYYGEWDDNEIMLHHRDYEFSESSIIIEK